MNDNLLQMIRTNSSHYINKLLDFLTSCWYIYFFSKSTIIQCAQCYHLWLSSDSNRRGHNQNNNPCSFRAMNCSDNQDQKEAHLFDSIQSSEVSIASGNHQNSRDDAIQVMSTDGIPYTLLIGLGSVYRELGTTAIFCYTLYMGIIFFYPKNPLFSRKLVEIDEKEFVVFLRDSNRSKQMIAKHLTECVNSALESNVNYLRSILGFWPIKTADGTRIISNFNEKYTKNQAVSNLNDYLQLVVCRKDSQNLHESDYRINHTSRRLIESLRLQYNHLVLLKSKNSSVWPANRYAARSQEISINFLHLQSMVMLIFSTMALISTSLAQYYGYKSIKNNHNLPGWQREFSPSERLMLIDQFIFTCVAVYWFSSPLIMLVVVLNDQMVSLKSISGKFKSFHILVKKLDKLKEEHRLILFETRRRFLEQRRIQKSSYGSSIMAPNGEKTNATRSSRGKEFGNFEEQITLYWNCRKGTLFMEENELKLACDKEAIEIYINFRLFLKQIDGPIKFAQHVMLKNILFIANCLLTTLTFFQGIKPEHLNFITILIILVMTLVDGALCVCAHFSSNCMKTIGQVFSLIARALNHQESYSTIFKLASQQQRQQQGPEPEPEVGDCQVDDQTTGRCRMSLLRSSRIGSIRQLTAGKQKRKQQQLRKLANPSEMMMSSFSVDLDYLYECPLSPHTLLLWRRLAQDQRPLVDRFVCSVAGFLKLDFENILRLNFWMISIVLLALTMSGSEH